MSDFYPNHEYWSTFLTVAGDGSGNKDFGGAGHNYSDAGSGLLTIKAVCPQGESLSIVRLIPFIQDAALRADSYGGVLGGLTNGLIIQLRHADDSLKYDLTQSLPIKTNIDWRRRCYDGEPSTFGAGDDAMNARWTFAKSKALGLTAGEYFAIDLHDDFTALTSQTFYLEGVRNYYS